MRSGRLAAKSPCSGRCGCSSADVGRGERGQVAGVLRGGEGLLDEFPQFVLNHSGDSLSRGAVGVRVGVVGRHVAKVVRRTRWYTWRMEQNPKPSQSSGLLAPLLRIAKRLLGRDREQTPEPDLPPLLPEPGPSGIPYAPPRTRR